jgi:YggT family protein
MQGQYGTNAIEFLVSTIVNLYVMVVLLRFLMQMFRVDFYNPISQFAVKVTTPLLKPIRRVIPGVAGIDVSTLLLAWLLLAAKMLLFKGINLEVMRLDGMGVYLQNMGVGVLLYFAVVDVLIQIIDIFFFVIIVQVILSWVNPNPHSPMHALLHSLSYPILKPFKKLLPPIAGVDITPLFALLSIQVLKMLIIPPLLGMV